MIKNVLISVLTVLFAFAIFVWKMLTDRQQLPSEADQYGEEDR